MVDSVLGSELVEVDSEHDDVVVVAVGDQETCTVSVNVTWRSDRSSPRFRGLSSASISYDALQSSHFE